MSEEIEISRILDPLSDIQRDAVCHSNGPAVVFAGAGSGKTRTLTHRIAYLSVQKACHPSQILALTFTNKAAEEMRNRTRALYPDSVLTTISTFHAVCARWLREFAHVLGYKSFFTILDDGDTVSTLKRILKSRFAAKEAASLAAEHKHFIGYCKREAILPENVVDRMSKKQIPKEGVEIYSEYQRELKSSNAMDFADLLLNTYLLLENSDSVRATLSNRYQFVLVDEYQDTNMIQLAIIKRIIGKSQNLFVVGDDDQSIYSWRGAVPANIVFFEKEFPSAKKFILGENYRCPQNIVAAAHALIDHNQVRVKKDIFSNLAVKHPISYYLEQDSTMEAMHVTNIIVEELKDFYYDEFAIFYRTNAQSRQFEEHLQLAKVPYKIVGTVRFYDRVEVKDILCYLRLAVNPSDDHAFLRVVNTPKRGLGDKSIERLQKFAQMSGCSLMEACRVIAEGNQSAPKGLSGFLPFFALIKTLGHSFDLSEDDSIVDTVIDLIDYKSYLKSVFFENYEDRLANLEELHISFASYRESKLNQNNELSLSEIVSEWLASISLFASEKNDDEEGVTLMTLHAAKGLEYKRVFITGLEQGLLPHQNSLESPDKLEEERRLFYVGMTRAREKLSLFGCETRIQFGAVHHNLPSQFLRDLPQELVECFGSGARRALTGEKNKNFAEQSLHYDYDIQEGSQMAVKGQWVSHAAFGPGVIRNTDSPETGGKVVVEFVEFGLKKIPASQIKPFQIDE